MTYKELLALVTPDIITDIMKELDVPLYKKSKDSQGQTILIFPTVCHGGDSHKLYYYSDSKSFYCYTNCGSLSIFEVLRRLKGWGENDFRLYKKFLAQKLGVEDSKGGFNSGFITAQEKENSAFLNKMAEYRELEETDKTPKSNNVYDASVLDKFEANTFYQGWINEGISIPTMKKFGIRYFTPEKYIIIPHYDINNQLIGIRRRSLKPQDAKNKYMPLILNKITYGHSLGSNLYGININKENIQKTQKALIVEAEKSVMLCDTFFGEKSIAVGTCGFNVTLAQITLLIKLGVNTVYLGFDKDYDITKEPIYALDDGEWGRYVFYRKKIEALAERLKSFFQVYIIYDKTGLLDIKDAPVDKGKETFLTLLKGADKFKRPTFFPEERRN